MRGSKTKMTFTVTRASKFSQHSVVQFLAAEGVSPIEIRRPMKKVYVDKAIPTRANITGGRPAPGQSHTVITEVNVVAADNLVRADRRCTVDEAAQNLNTSNGFAYSKIHDRFKYHKLRAKWVQNGSQMSRNNIEWD
ncbi:hypothetical protein ANN_19191 [Periplaneta americana]|uniref:Uncharacterized protein n=1 Tax=Periplaneta americana TaxID=6978 RepID=A0ABQ8S957_PERAM|nr:hypothetical protein ANN_19191 [Periplaneta americana]